MRSDSSPPGGTRDGPRPEDVVRRSIASTEGTVCLAEGFVAAGRPVDLGGLDREVAALCAAAAALPAEVGRTLRGDLAGLLARVDSLASRLSASRPPG